MENTLRKKESAQVWQAHVVEAQRGDLQAFERIGQRFEDMATAYAYSILGDFQLAEDAAQEAFIQVYLDLATLREPLAFPTWLRRVVLKQCDRFTRKKRFPAVSLDADWEIADPAQNPYDAFQQRETHDAVHAAMNALPEHERAATALFYINGYSMAEVGQFLDVPVSTVKNRLHSARKRLKERMVGLVEETLKQNAPGDDFSRRVRHVLEDVPQIGFYRQGDICPEDIPFPSSLAACLRFMGEECPYLSIWAHNRAWRLNYMNVYLLGVSGLAFGLLWRSGWHANNADLMQIAPDPREIIHRAFEAVGHDYEIVAKAPDGDNEEYLRRRIVESLRDRGRPVLAFGVVGPPECCIITGYDKDGDILVGWSYFQDAPEFCGERERSGYFRKWDWYKDTWSLILIGDKRAKPASHIIYHQALAWGLQIMRTPSVNGRHSGHAAYRAWAEHLLCDSDFAVSDETTLRQRYAVHNDAALNVAEGRAWGGVFLRQAALELPNLADELVEAGNCFSDEHDLMWRVWNLAGGHHSPTAYLELAKPDVRRRIVSIIQDALRLDMRAADLIECALAKAEETGV